MFASFDCPHCREYLAQIRVNLQALAEIRRVCSDVAFVALPIRGTHSAWDSPDHWHAFTADEFERLLKKSEFVVQQYYEDSCGCQNWLVTERR